MKGTNPPIDILLPTFNGAKYLNDQVRSIMSQTYENLCLIIRDDGSTDDTIELLTAFKKTYGSKIELILDNYGNLGTAKSVMKLMEHSNAPFIMLSDQDDVWYEYKVECLIKKILNYSKKEGGMPLLVASDSRLVDADRNRIGKSFVKNDGINMKRIYFSNILQMNIVQGASCIFNRELLELIMKFDNMPEGIYQDYWLALTASAFGKIFYYKKPLMDYRQHGNNAVGVSRNISELKWWTGTEADRKQLALRHYLTINKKRCREVKSIWGSKLSARNKQILDYYSSNPYDLCEYVRMGLWREYGIVDNIWRFMIGML
ncbi:glycosyltransferase family 2 protein [Enterocloster bolteae]|uniref:glycosyltransferase family 2 protein n=1 Tax=Enterocloster bolteae TaxID=208479 RepID=UPI002904BEDC|nr:glycosyltransferase family 2 protein [Enterocloster bolteae]MDU1138075.1 glycosyltransferase family 2 protein [Enterocloster bolteae]